MVDKVDDRVLIIEISRYCAFELVQDTSAFYLATVDLALNKMYFC